MKQSVYYISKMDCPSEEALIRNRLRNMPGVENLDFNLLARELTVAHDLDDDSDLLSALESLKLGAQRKASIRTESDDGEGTNEYRETIPIKTRWLLGLSGMAAVAAELLAYSTGNEGSWPVVALALVSIAAGGRETLLKGLAAVRTLTLNINFLMTLAVAGAILIGQWPEAAMVTFLFGIAEMIEALSLDRARNAIRGLMEMTPETASIMDAGGAWQKCPVSEVQVGQLVRVIPGERIPLDGTVTTGASSVNQAPITGESMPVEKRTGDTVFAGSINERGAFEFTVTANKGNTTLARIIAAVQQAQGERAPTQRFVDRFSLYYTPVVVIAAILVAVVPPLFFGAAFSPWLYKALVLLVIACPCALVISTPVTVVSGLAAAARRGILVKGGVYLEAGFKVRAIALDKTGTLTNGKPVLTDIVLFDSAKNAYTKNDVLQLAASLDVLSEHPVASAIVAAWSSQKKGGDESVDSKSIESVRNSNELLPVEDFESITGRGVTGRISGSRLYIGNHRLAEENRVCKPHVEAALGRLEAEGKTAVLLTTDTEVLAVLSVADTLRDTSVEAVQSLHALGIRSVMLTGDNSATARAIAAKVGIDDVRGELLPEDKLAAMNELLVQYGAVGMVGDGINDAPALAKSTIGFAMGAAGSDTAIETADVAFMQDDLRKLPTFIRLSRRTKRVLTQNITLAIAIKVVFFALALTGHATLWMAVFADMGGSLLVVFNGLRLLKFDGTTTKLQ